jgi:steroid 5-alpha reductase family enzyme
MSGLQLFLVGWGGIALVMLVLWYVQYRTRNAGIVDVAWSLGTGLLGVAFALVPDGGDPARKVLVAALVGIWALRLGLHLAQRVSGEAEDGRYRVLRERLGDRLQPFMFGFFQLQAVWAVLFALPIWAAARAPAEGLQLWDGLGLAVWLVAMGGEAIADAQLARFRRTPGNRGKVCRVGLWRYSRHPNYFFEWLHWFAYVLIGVGSSWWWLTWAGVVAMLVFLLKVTGVPHTEQQALRSRGAEYRRYQRTTSVFLPLPPKPDPEEARP